MTYGIAATTKKRRNRMSTIQPEALQRFAELLERTFPKRDVSHVARGKKANPKPKPYMVRIMNNKPHKEDKEEPCIGRAFDKYQVAKRWAYCKLDELNNDYEAEIIDTRFNFVERVTRTVAICQLYNINRLQSYKRVGCSKSTLAGKSKCQQTKVKFSRG